MPGPAAGGRTDPVRRGRFRLRFLLVAAVIMAAASLFLTGPSAPAPTGAPPDADPAVLRGAFHIHTTRSDGALDKRAVAAAAARAGLQFAIFTDHGDATRDPDPPEYIDGVLCVDGVEISTNDGHYVALGLAVAPYPLGGDAQAVIEDVSRLGGLGVAAHPSSIRTELAWQDWESPIDALEWINADSEWRDESGAGLARGLADYLWRPAGALAALLDRPVSTLARWDRLTATRRVTALAAHDAHGGFGAEAGSGRGRRVHLPSYESSFRTFSSYVQLDVPPTGVAAEDTARLLQALRRGRTFTAVDALAGPPRFRFAAIQESGHAAGLGDVVEVDRDGAPVRLQVEAAVPDGAGTRLLRNGEVVAEASGGSLQLQTRAAGAYRVEVALAAAPGHPPVPWLVSNPIYLRDAGERLPEPMPPPHPVAILPLGERAWRIEAAPGSSGTVAKNGYEVQFSYSLGGGERASQFVALVVDVALVPREVDTITFRGAADRPMRVSAQLRFARDGDARWRRSVYLDAVQEREIRIPVATLRAAEATAPASAQTVEGQMPTVLPVRPAIDRATSLLFVVDLTNAVPGASGRLMLRDVALARAGRTEK